MLNMSKITEFMLKRRLRFYSNKERLKNYAKRMSILDPAKIQVKLKDYYFWMFFKKREVKNMELRFKK